MSDQFQLWLIPPLLTALLSIWVRRRVTLGFGWPLLVQACMIAASSLLGLLIGPKPLWAVITWVLFGAFMIFPTLFLRHCEQLYSTLNAPALAKAANTIPIFYWGQLGRFWRDTYAAYALYIRGDEVAGDALLARWQAVDLPPFFKEHIDASKLAVFGLLARWDSIIEIFEQRSHDNDTVSASLCLQASRAFAERGNNEMATKCLKSANLPNQRMDQRQLSLVFLQYFALCGAESHVNQIVEHLVKGAPSSMRLICNGWSARAIVAAGRYDEAADVLQKLIIEAKAINEKTFDSTAWVKRLEGYLVTAEKLKREEASGVRSITGKEDERATLENIEQIWQIYKNAQSVQQVVLPKKSSLVVNLLLTAMTLIYLLSGCVDLIDNQFVLGLIGHDSDLLSQAAHQGEFMFRTFYLDKSEVVAGQYYRLVSYIFLHGNLSHLLLNAFGLMWFGRIATSIFGPWRFLAIFFIAGIAGGAAQIAFTDVSAVGASGAVFGIFSAVAVAIFKLKDVLPQQMRQRELRWMAVMTVCQVGLDRVVPQVAGYCHLGGLLAGLIAGYLLFPSQSFKNAEKKRD